jgi:hypothetical protein
MVNDILIPFIHDDDEESHLQPHTMSDNPLTILSLICHFCGELLGFLDL